MALKELKKQPGEQTSKDWKREVNALKAFNKFDGQHIVRGIGAFTQDSKFYIMMEWADQGDLRGIWTNKRQPHISLTQSHVEELLEQFRGLAIALHKMHTAGVTAQKADQGLLPPQSQNSRNLSAGASSANENWRHGDLKPDNILSFKNGSSLGLGTLKIADLGRAKQRMENTAMKVGTTELFSTVAYDSPEIQLAPDKGRSRLVDVWSFGCVLFESIVWLFFGSEVLDRFLKQPKIYGSIYWTLNSFHDKTAKLSEGTFLWMDELLKQDPECKPSREPSALRDLVNLIKTKLLVIRYEKISISRSSAECRINSEDLVKELDTIIENGKKIPGYFFSGHKRQNVKAPPITTVVTGKSNINKPNIEDSL